jgi:hypothetical protein
MSPNRKTEINIKLSPTAKEIYDQLGHPKNRFVSDAIIEKWAKEHGEIFTGEQIEWIRKEIASFLSGKE